MIGRLDELICRKFWMAIALSGFCLDGAGRSRYGRRCQVCEVWAANKFINGRSGWCFKNKKRRLIFWWNKMRIWTATVDRIRRESAATKSFSLLRCVCVSTFCVDCTCCQLSNVLIDQQRFVFYFFSPPSFALFPLPDASFRSQLSEPIRAGRSVRETWSVSCVLTCFDHFLGQLDESVERCVRRWPFRVRRFPWNAKTLSDAAKEPRASAVRSCIRTWGNGRCHVPDVDRLNGPVAPVLVWIPPDVFFFYVAEFYWN